MVDRLRSVDSDTRLMIWLSPLAIPIVVNYASMAWTLLHHLAAFGRAVWTAVSG